MAQQPEDQDQQHKPPINIVRALMNRIGINSTQSSSSSSTVTSPLLLTRKGVQEMIAAGAVKVNDTVITSAQGCLVTETDAIHISPDALEKVQRSIKVFAYDKPVNIDSCLNANDKTSLLHVLVRHGFYPQQQQSNQQQQPLPAPTDSTPVVLSPVGRLDKCSNGLLLLTNSGALSERILNPAFQHSKQYLVQVSNAAKDFVLTDAFLEKMRSGVSWRVSGGKQETSLPCQVEEVTKEQGEKTRKPPRGESPCFIITLTQGLNRQIRNMVEAATGGNAYVTFLRRIRVGPISLAECFAGDQEDKEIVEITGAKRAELLKWAFESGAKPEEDSALQRRQRDD